MTSCKIFQIHQNGVSATRALIADQDIGTVCEISIVPGILHKLRHF